MTMKLQPSSRKSSSVMEIPSVVNTAKEVVTQKMDILMILNPSDAKVRTEDHSDNESINSEMSGRNRHEQPSHYIQQPRPISGEHPLIHYQTQLEALESQNHTRLLAVRSGRTQLPPAPIYRRPLTFNPINAPHRYTTHNSLPPIFPIHDEGYHSPSPAHHYRHERHHQLHHRRQSHSVPTPNKKKPRSNKTYTVEEVDFIRYYKEDLNKRWPEVLSCFRRCFIERQRDSEQSLSSRYYRDNCLKMYDASDRLMRDDNGKIKTISAKVRRRGTPAGREEALPYTLVQKHPERAMRYPWVLEQHKVEARRLAAEMSDQAREILNSQRAQQLRKEELERGIVDERRLSSDDPMHLCDPRDSHRGSIDESMDEFSSYEGSSTASSPQISPRSSP
ncbi:hypothetical protein EYC80_010468 [Monilinia laxa]|uniref:Uncharacterized protein n=1 Tax=Monilinia laxa TaxID=61186 RepID=A0A5N6JN20_MONLA|nr:hypothetical protein EYC80_010468 [Monilinia laxa]